MSKNYKQLSLKQRYKIEALYSTGMNQKEIALHVEVHPSTICRELKRNIAKRGRTSGTYVAENAARKTNFRHQQKAKHIVFTSSMKESIVSHMSNEKWSPEIISKTISGMISHEWIYQWIWSCKHTNLRQNRSYKRLYQLLKHGKRRQKRGNKNDNRGIITHRTPIEQRPDVVKQRTRIGDIEVDLMMGKDHKGALLVMTDRATLHTRLTKLEGKESMAIFHAIMDKLKDNPYKAQTLTFDNDMAFSQHYLISQQTGIPTYFTRPYTSQDKGTVENRIGVVRRFFPKKTNLTFVSTERIKEVENLLNERPIRKFNYKNANQVLLDKIALIT